MISALKWKSLFAGAATFWAAHAIEVARWRPWFGGAEHAPWFLNDGNRAVAFMAGCVLVATFVTGMSWVRGARDAIVHGVNVAAGAAVAMTALLLTAPWGPGNLFPIALAIGALILLLSTLVASGLVAALKRRST